MNFPVVLEATDAAVETSADDRDKVATLKHK